MGAEVKSFASPDETREFEGNGHAKAVTLAGHTVLEGTFEPGWKWSADVKPIAGTDSCQVLHTGFCVSGTMTIRMNDGTESTVSAGDVVRIEPGHDAWVDGPDPCILLDTGVAGYAKPD